MKTYNVQYTKPDTRRWYSNDTVKAVRICSTYTDALAEAERLNHFNGYHVDRIVFQDIDTTGTVWTPTETRTLWENTDK